MMRKLLVTALVVVGALTVFPLTSSAQSGNLRLLFHATKSVASDSFFGWDAWVIAPNVTNAPNKWMAVSGPRLQGKDWWSEFNFGDLVQSGKPTSVVDIRTNWPFPRPLSFWTNLEWFDFSSAYIYAEVDHPLPGGFVVGLETEDNLPDKTFGPHLKVIFGQTIFQAIYQFHRGGDHLWFRLVVNLH